VNGLIARILIFYIGSLTMIMALIPWRRITAAQSPFVMVFAQVGLPAAAAIINVVLISAVISSCNSGLFASARILRSLAASGHAPAFISRLNRRGVPAIGISISVGALFFGVVLNYFVPGKVLDYILSASAILMMANWAGLMVSHVGFRSKLSGKTKSRYSMPFYPLANWLVLLFIAGIIVIMGAALEMYATIAFTLGFYLLLAVGYRLRVNGRRPKLAR